jgi:hypothetical protein
LRSALARAKPGNVIAIKGMIQITRDLQISTPGIVLTCDKAGSGLQAAGTNPGDFVQTLLLVTASGVQVNHLVVDSRAAHAALVALGSDGLPAVQDVVFEDNSIQCATDELCVEFLGNVEGGRISRNEITGEGTNVAIRLFARITFEGTSLVRGTRVEDNVLTAPTNVASALWGLEMAFADRIVVTGNTIHGPWRIGMHAVNLSNSTIRNNVIDGPRQFGILVPRSFTPDEGLNGSSVALNRIRGTGEAAISLNVGCGNDWYLNDISGNGSGMFLLAPTGNNRVTTTEPNLINDAGAYDCDGDGVNDPNTIIVP